MAAKINIYCPKCDAKMSGVSVGVRTSCPDCGEQFTLDRRTISVDELKRLVPPLRHERLPADLEARLRGLWQRLGKDLMAAETFEQLETNFCRDVHPVREIEIYEDMERQLKEWEQRRLVYSANERKQQWWKLFQRKLETDPPIIDEPIGVTQQPFRKGRCDQV